MVCVSSPEVQDLTILLGLIDVAELKHILITIGEKLTPQEVLKRTLRATHLTTFVDCAMM
jgi:hypothetical protein